MNWINKHVDLQAIEMTPDYVLISIILGLSILALTPVWINYDIIAMDGTTLYVPVSKRFLERNFFDVFFGLNLNQTGIPFYEFLISLLSKATGIGLETSGRLISALSYVFGSVGIYKLIRILSFNKLFSLLGVLIYLSNRQLLGSSVECLKEALLVCLIIWGNYFIIKGISSKEKILQFGLGLICIIAACLLRSTTCIILVAWIILWVFHEKRGLIFRLLIFIISIVVFSLLSLFLKESMLFKKSYNVHDLFFTGMQLNPYGLMMVAYNLIRDFLKISNYLFGVIGFIGLYLMRKLIYGRFQVILLFIFFMLLMLTYSKHPDHQSGRYILAPIILLIPCAVYAIKSFVHSENRLVHWMVILIILVFPVSWMTKAFKEPDSDRLAWKEAGKWILSQIGPNHDIVTNRERIAFYADGNIIMIYETLNEHTLRHAPNVEMAQMILEEGKYLMIGDLVENRTLKKTVAIDTKLENAKTMKVLLDSHGFTKPNKKFRDIAVYLPN
jgi:hypothetical protein